MRLDNKWLAHAPAKTVKGNNKDSHGEIEDVPYSELGELGSNLDSLPWGNSEVTPSIVIVKQQENTEENYVDDLYVESGYVESSPQSWVKLTWDQFIAFVEGEGSTGETAYVKTGYVESGYVE